ncbi:MAG: DUF3604 domain-containing protein [Candidatus Latescibacteria bacterium]|nr:DUF3604 domain-containing protein [Candidatus Latescibacterota bacterium]
MTDAESRRLYGYAEMDPTGPVVAGSTGTWRITYHAGLYGVDDGGVIKVVWRFVSDWGAPQFRDPKAAEYATVSTTGPASLRAAFEMRRYVRPWNRCVTVDVFDESLSEGDRVTLTLGDTSGGSPGSRAQSFCQEAFEFRVAVDWCGTGVFVEVPVPSFPVVSGPAHRLVVVGPSEVGAGEATWVGVKAEDVWGNVCADYDGEVWLDGGGLSGLPEAYRFRPEDRGVRRFEGVKGSETGVYRVKAEDRGNGMAAEGNPLRCVEGRRDHRPFWGDLHGQSGETIGTNPVSSYFRFARDAALLDFAGHQGNDFQITREAWEEIRRQENAHNRPGGFVTFVGYEWSGNTPLGGDHNVYYLADDGPLHRSSHVLIPDSSDVDTDCTTVTDLYAALKGKEAMLVPHVGGRYSNMAWHDPELERVIEVYSSWGEFEWFLREALERGYKVGFVAGSDDHKGRPGAAHPGSGAFGVYGGLACIYARELTRAGVWEALRARRCYGTTGQRILLEVMADGHPMGAEYAATGPPEVSVRVWGTAPVERVDLFRGVTQVYSFPETVQRSEREVRIAWSGQRIRARNRLAVWDGSLEIDRGRILKAEGYAFDAPSEGLREVTERSVVWKSVTTGDADGVVLTLDAPPEATLDFRTGIVSRKVSLREIAEGPVTAEAGGIDMKVVFERLPLGAGREVAFTFREKDLAPGCHPYWVRVTQTDGAKAWSSPIYVTIP